MTLRRIIRIVLALFGLVCVFDGLLNAFRLYALQFREQVTLFPLFGPWGKMGIGALFIGLALLVSGLLERMALRNK
jgi:hypothetical protein